jgi:structural maintenance of chromosome 2
MEFIFGSVLVCSDLNVANKLAFDRSVGKMCVTLQGDKVNPAGELSGGAPSSGGSLLTHVASIQDVKAQLAQLEGKFKEIDHKLRNVGPVGKRYDQLTTQLEIKARFKTEGY